MTTAALIIAGTLLSAFGCYIIYQRRIKLTLIDMYVFFVSQYFGLLSVVDGLLNEVENYDLETVLYVHFLVFISIFIISCLSKIRQFNKGIKYFSLNEMLKLSTSISSNNMRVVSVLLLLIHIIIRLTLMKDADALSEAYGRANLFENLPYWATSILSLYRTIFFIAVIFSFISILSVVKEKKRAYIFDITIFILLFLGVSQFGRTYSFNAAFICLLIFIARNHSKFTFSKITLYFSVSLLSVLLFSNYHQTYRNGKNSDIDKLTALFNFNATFDNLRVRSPMWRFNYAIAESRWFFKNGPDYPGQISLKVAAAAVPSLLSPGISKVVGDDEISTVFRIAPTDFPSNIYATFLADFGYFSIILVPFLILIVVGIFYRICRYTDRKYPQVSLFYFIFLWQHLAFVESEFVVVPLLFRDAVIFGIIMYIFIFFTKIIFHRSGKMSMMVFR